jgi:nucleoside transporter
MSEPPSRKGTATKLSVMMFFQFFTWGAWFATLGQCLGDNNLAAFGGGAYGSAPIAAMLAPLFLGIVADRFFPSQIVMGVLFLLGGGFMLAAESAAGAGNGDLMVWFMIAHMLCYMPTLGLANTIVFTHIARGDFPKVRVWGTIGWIVAGLFIGFMGWTSSINMFNVAAASSLFLGVYSFVLPHTPAPAKGQELNWKTLFMVDAFKLLKNPGFAVFLICSTLICVPLAYYYGLTGNYLTNAGFEQAASTMTIGQMSEIFFMLLIPFFFRRLGVKWMILIGMGAWVLRYLLFAFGADDQVAWMLLFAVALHGLSYDFFFVTGFMYADRVAPKEVRGQTQSLLVFLTQGVGMYFGYQVAFGRFGAVEGYKPLNDSISAARESGDLSFMDKLSQMFSVNMPDSVDASLINRTMDQWETFWLFPAMMAAVIAVIFFFTFWDKTKVMEEDEEVEPLAPAAEPKEAEEIVK